MFAFSSEDHLPLTWGAQKRLTRRKLIASACALGVGKLISATPLRAAETQANMAPGTIDVHHHFFPTALREETHTFLTRVYGAVPPAIANWTPEAALEALDRNGIAKAVIGTSARPPAPDMTPEKFLVQARACNDYGAKMVQDHPKRFAQFGYLPMPDLDGSLKEIEYTLDVLKAPGVGMMTSYGNRWQGHPDFDPILQELNRRKAVVFCHPLPAACCTNLMPTYASRESQLVEFPYDTGRAVVGLLMSGSLVRYRDIKWIFSHCGDVVPALSGRMRNVFSDMPPEQVAKFAPHGMDYELRRLYYDTADGAYAPSMAAIRAYVPNSQIMFGTDYPYVSVDKNVREIHARHLPAADLLGIERTNTLKLMPSLA
jgi:predicted TIM-barrel fold metal-dependent hydrolase